MLNLGLIGFSSPWLLTALLALPAIWWLLRLVPPAPKRIQFPPLMILRRVEEIEETPDRSPWWLLLLRLLIAILLILALAGPLLNPQSQIAGSGPITILLDDSYASAAGFEKRRQNLAAIAEQAKRDNRAIRLIRTAPSEDGIDQGLMDAEQLSEILPGIDTRPYLSDHVETAEALNAIEDLGTVIWLTATPLIDQAEAVDLANRIQERAALRIMGDRNEGLVPQLDLPVLSALGFDLTLWRPGSFEPWAGHVVAIGPTGEIFAREPVTFDKRQEEVSLTLALPRELRNQTARIQIEPLSHAGQQVLLDERWRRRTVALWSGSTDEAQPLLGELYFVRKAVQPHAEIIDGPLLELLEKPVSLLVVGDHGQFDDDERQALTGWIDGGGVLLRFAGPRLAAADGELVPVPIRTGERELGGAMSWSEPVKIKSFNPEGPFAGLVPPDDVLIRRQVLSEPSMDMATFTLAELEDGTPLITGRKRGDGWLILIHTTANADWSNFALSGLFVDLMRRSIELGPGAGGVTRGALQASLVLDASGQLHEPERSQPAIDAAVLDASMPGPEQLAGLYGPVLSGSRAEQDLPRKAFNIQNATERLQPFPELVGLEIDPFETGEERDLGHILFGLALLLLLIDSIVALALRGLLPKLATATAAIMIIMLHPAGAQQLGDAIDPERIIELTEVTRLGYVMVDGGPVDDLSEAGLRGLIEVLSMRTSIEAGDPVPVNLDTDPIDLFPLLYWPVTAGSDDLPDETKRRIGQYLRGGGMILIDTKDAGVLLPGQDGGGPGEARLAELLTGMDLAPLEPVPQDHVLTRSFYLLQDFPGRWTGQIVWVDRASTNVNDGVSGLIIGANDWAAAWAIDRQGRFLYPVVPGGERQREMAFRFGVNLVMYAMTGNYKTDQVHIPALLERLGE